jgi:hypothetical protein
MDWKVWGKHGKYIGNTPYYRLESFFFWKPAGYDKTPSGSKAKCKVGSVFFRYNISFFE